MSVYLESNPSNYLKYFLTKREQQSLSLMQGTLRHIFENNLLLKDIRTNCDVPRLVLDLYANGKIFKGGGHDTILVKLLESASTQAPTAIRQLRGLIQSGRAELVFACAETAEQKSMSSEKLLEMLDLFTKKSNQLDTLDSLPPYEAGGKELLIPVMAPVTFAQLSKQSSSCDYQQFRSLAIQYLSSLSTNERLPMATYLRWMRELDTSSQSEPISYRISYILGALERTTGKERLMHNLDKTLENREKVPEDHSSIEILYNRFAGRANDPSVLFPISEEMLTDVLKQYETVLQYCQELNDSTLHDLVEHSRQTVDPLRLLAIGRLALWRCLGSYPYQVQILAVLCEMQFPQGAVAQIKTGEGKSMIAALLAFVLVRTKRTQGPIISSTHYLAKHAQKEYSSFFVCFGITSMDICDRHALGQKYEADILYGTASDFEFSVMTELLYNKKLFRGGIDTGFDWAIVDEMDNLSIDTSLNSARLSFPAKVNYDWVYEPILKYVSQEMSPTVSFLRKTLQTIKPVDDLSDNRLAQWLQSSYRALNEHLENTDYVISSKQEKDGHIKKEVLIVDAKNTGRIMHGSRWSSGVHEFVEVKHGIDPKQESLCPLSLCHPVFYTMFKSIYGITGTTGTQVERSELNELYGLQTFDVPTHKPLLRYDKPLAIYETDEQHLAHLDALACDMRESGRALLILCETIHESKELSKRFTTKNIAHEVLNEIQHKSEDEILDMAGVAGAITIATNTAGRGTDIKLTNECKNNGGLHVEIAFYPESERVEFQARGRAGRQGQAGSSAICVSKQKLVKDNSLFILLDNQQIALLLRKKRELRGLKQKGTHIFYAAGHRVAFTYTKQFYNLLNNFYDNQLPPPYFDKVIELLNNRKIISSQVIDFEKLPLKMQPIASTALSLLTSKTYSKNNWKALVQKLLKRMREAFIQDFAINFHDAIDQIIHLTEDQLQNELSALSEEATRKQEIEVQILLQKFIDCEERHQQTLIQKIDTLYLAQSGTWEKYLDPSGRGLLTYLGDLIQVDLSPMKADSW